MAGNGAVAPRSATYTSGPITTGEESVPYGSWWRQSVAGARVQRHEAASDEVANTRPFDTAGDPYAQPGSVVDHASSPLLASNEYTLPSVFPT